MLIYFIKENKKDNTFMTFMCQLTSEHRKYDTSNFSLNFVNVKGNVLHQYRL